MRGKNVLRILITVSAVLLLCSILYSVFQALSLLLTSTGAAVVLLVLSLLLARLLLGVAIFPGSKWFWRRSIEAHFCKELSAQLMLRVKDLQTGLLFIMDKLSDYEKQDFLSKCIEAPYNAMKLILLVTNNLMRLKLESGLSSRQVACLELLINLQTSLQDLQLVLPNNTTLSFWDWIEQIELESDWFDVVFEDFPSNRSASSALNACDALIRRLYDSCSNVGRIAALRRWLFDTSFGTLQQMRLELCQRFSCQSVSLQMPDGHELDGVWIPSQDPRGPSVLLLNPNAGYFELAYYQSDWVDFYLNRGVSVLLYNYRGYGRSGGRPSPSKLRGDAQAVVDYMRDVLKVRKVGVHGESLGGMIAAHLGATKGVSFLFADRTFSGLGQVARHKFGRWASWLLRAISRWDHDCAADFAESRCYKVVSADPYDNMITDLASLKAGIALRLLGRSSVDADFQHLTSRSVFDSLFASYMFLMKAVVSHEKQEDPQSSEYTHSVNYLPVPKRADTHDDEALNNMLYNIFNVLDCLDAGGKLLSSVFSDKRPKLSLKVWLIVLDTWGSFYPIELGANNRKKAEASLANACRQLEIIIANNSNSSSVVAGLSRELSTLVQCFAVLRQALGESGVRGNAGHLIPLTCGHGGAYNVNEVALADWHLKNSGFLHQVM